MELQIEARIKEMTTASKDYDGLTDESIISSYFLEIEVTSFYSKR